MIHVDNKNGVKEADPVIIHNILSHSIMVSDLMAHLPSQHQFAIVI
jgi:hypothetical protein